jgi:hypothetical protein
MGIPDVENRHCNVKLVSCQTEIPFQVVQTCLANERVSRGELLIYLDGK